MRTFNLVSGGVATLLLVLGLAGPSAVFAATSPSLGAAAGFSVLSGAGATNGGAGTTTLSGDLGVSPAASYTDGGTTVFLPPAVLHLGDLAAANAQAAQLAVFNGPAGIDAASQPCTTTYAVTQDLTGLTLNPGVYCTPLDFLLSGTLTLNGTGSPATDVWIFRAGRDLVGTGTANVVFSGTGGNPCNVWWRLVRDATFSANNAMVGNILAANSVTFGQSATLDGRAFAYTAAVTMLGNTISGPTCTVAAPASSVPKQGTINVVKVVINDNGGTKTVSDFPLFVSGTPVSSGVTNTFPSISGVYSVTETVDPGYATTFTRTYSADCDANGQLNLTPGQNKFCIVTNDDIGAPVVVPPVPPLIDVVKVPSPLALPAGPGAVTYTYTLRNIGTVPVTNVTMVGDTCSPIALVSGDSNTDAKLDVSETWTYRCSTTLTETHTNTVVATGWANGISATDIASATVVVGTPAMPPLIHITKIPAPLTLLAGGGTVTYTKRVTNPGTVALSNVLVTDNKCAPTYVSGDVNGDSKLDPAETWTYTCSTNLTQTTTNTAIATGEANGLIARDFAIATVVVAAAVPALPKTGFAPAEGILAWGVVAAGILAVSLLLCVNRRKSSV